MVKGKKQVTLTTNRSFFFFTSLFLCHGFLCSNPFHSGHAALRLLCNYSSSNLWTTDAWDSTNWPLTFWELLRWVYICAGRSIYSLQLIAGWSTFPYMREERVCVCIHVQLGGFIPCGRVMQAPSTIACASSRSLHSAARAAALSASQISFRPSKAGAVSQNSSLLLLSWPSVIGYSLFHFGRSFLRGSLRPESLKKKKGKKAVLNLMQWSQKWSKDCNLI